MIGQRTPSASSQMREAIDTIGGCAAVQRDLSRLEKWADKNLLKFKNRE